MIRAIKLIIDVKVSDFSEEWKLSIGALSAGVPSGHTSDNAFSSHN